MVTRLEQDLWIQIGDWDAFWLEANHVENAILRQRYTETGDVAMTYNEIADSLGRRREWVRGHLAKAMRLMRHPVRRDKYGGRPLSAEERLK